MLNKGDTCYVRFEGKLIKAGYGTRSRHPKSHWVVNETEGTLFATTSVKDADDCRFVVMSGMRKEYVEAIK